MTLSTVEKGLDYTYSHYMLLPPFLMPQKCVQNAIKRNATFKNVACDIKNIPAGGDSTLTSKTNR